MQDKGSLANPTSVAAQQRRREEQRRRTMTAMLEVSGELGYADASVRRVLERSGANSSQFYADFDDRADCFAAAYAAEADRLCTSLLDAAAAEVDWREGLRAALLTLFRFAVERPLIARAIFRQAYVAGGAALVKHQEVLERLSRAFDGACRETSGSRHTPPPITATFIVGAVEEIFTFSLDEPERLWTTLPELMHLATGPYLGDEVAREELHRPPPTNSLG
jgi:AcrR family transcriptional regulator